MPERSLARHAAASLPPVRRLLDERDELRREVERLRAAVPPAPAGQVASAGDVVDGRRGDYDYVFVMTYGRSGSTLLQGILNSTPGVMIRGENRGITYRLFEYHRSAVKDAAWIGDVGRRKVNPFFGIRDYPANLALARFRELVLDTLLRPKPATKMVGFKEIRWYQDDLAEYVAFMREVFPGARFIVNTRRLEDVAKSSWMANREDPLGDLQVIEKRILDVAADLGPAAFHVHYDEYVEEPTRLRGLFDWLGLEFDEARVRKAMEFQYARMPDSPKPRDEDAS